MSHRSPSPRIDSADIDWTGGAPVSRRFGDVYYSRENGLAESRHVFIDGNDLPGRWIALKPDSDFRIFETGFGTGLNFLCAARLWLATAPADCRLHFISVEKYPLPTETLRGALARWEESSPLVSELLDRYPPLVPGVHRCWLYGGRINLTLVFDDALAGLSGLLYSDHPDYRSAGPPAADAWFLDGFAPSKNPDLWSADLFSLMACFSHRHTTLATFTVARGVREGLTEAGFQLEKRPGFGRKREMLTGSYGGHTTAFPDPGTYDPPRYLRNSPHESPWYLSLARGPAEKSAAIIGAGIAGCSVAAAMKRRGFSVTLVDSGGKAGMEASGNPQGILYPRLSPQDSPLSMFALHALCHARSFYRRYWETGGTGHRCGVLLLPENGKERDQFDAVARRYGNAATLVRPVQGNELKAVSGLDLATGTGLYFPDLGWIGPAEVCAWLTKNLDILAARASSLEFDPGRNCWRVLDGDGACIVEAAQVIIAGGHRAGRFAQSAHLPLRPVRGQITALPATSESLQLATVLCGAGYLAPSLDGVHTLGATYDVDDTRTDIRETDHRRNLAALSATDGMLPAILQTGGIDTGGIEGRAAIRCTTPDYLPVVGPVPVSAEMERRFALLGKNARASIPLPGEYYPGLWITAGHGSRGFTYAPLAAELLAARICNDILPVPLSLAVALNPARFIMRQVKRNSVSTP